MPRAVSPEGLVRRRELAISVTSGVAFALCTPPVSCLLGVPLGLVALAWLVGSAPSLRRAATRAWLWATAAGIVGLAFVPAVVDRFTPVGLAGGWFALPLLAGAQALTWAIGGGVAWLTQRHAGAPRSLAFAIGTLIALSLPGVFTWTPAALLSPWPVLLQSAELIGERGVSVVMALAASLVAFALAAFARSRRITRATWAPMAAAVGLVLIAWWHGRRALARYAAPLGAEVSLGVVQGAVDARLRWDTAARDEILASLKRLTVESERGGATLTLWPEAAYPFVVTHGAQRMRHDATAIVGRAVRGPVLFGLITQDESGDGEYNSTTIVSRTAELQPSQDKMQLLWFGETLPLGQHVPWLRRTFYRAGGLLPGRDVALLRHGAARIGVLNCYEDTLPGVGRRLALAGANLLVNVTNDAWFVGSAEAELHLRLSVLRAIELRRDLVRAVNLGVPAYIDAAGVIRARGDAARPSVLFVSARTNDESPTLYARVGDAPSWFAAVIAVAASYAARRRRERTVTGPSP